MWDGVGAKGPLAGLRLVLGLGMLACSSNNGDDSQATSNTSNQSGNGAAGAGGSSPTMPSQDDDPQSGDDVPGGPTVPTTMAPEIFQQLAGHYVGDLSGATALVCGSLLPLFGAMADEALAVNCGKGGMHRVEVTEAGIVDFLDATQPLQFFWSNRAYESPPSSTRVNGMVTYTTDDRNLTITYPSVDDLSFDFLSLRFHQSDRQQLGELTMPLTRME